MHIWQKHLGIHDNAASSYHRLIRKELIDSFSSPRQRVIEIGSSGGYTGKYCKEKFSGCEYWGFELNKAAAKESLPNIDKVICGKFEEQSLDVHGLAPASVDGVVLGDVLEHMYDPWRTLTALQPWLTEDAELVISIPNIRNLWILNHIAEGNFSYQENGILDVTHIRFFTLREIYSMMDATGYFIEKGGIAIDERLIQYHSQNRNIQGPHVFQYNNIAVRAMGQQIDELCAKQFIFLAKRKPNIYNYLPQPTIPSTASLVSDFDSALEKDTVHYAEFLPPAPASVPIDVKLFSFYLPQFHPTPENSRWWGEGFTEWNNVTRALPAFPGHYQPRHPGELGYYDLRVPEVMSRQVEMAKQAGLSGFIFYYYWFSGKRMLEMPLNQYMQRFDELQLPFFVMWCNENWRRTWVDKKEHAEDLLMEHRHLPDDPERFIEDLHPILTHPGYYKIDGKPVILVYPMTANDGAIEIENLKSTIDRWRKHAKRQGIGEILIGGLEKSGLLIKGQKLTVDTAGVDFFFEFPPNNSMLYEAGDDMAGVHDFYDSENEIKIVHYNSLVQRMTQAHTVRPIVRTVLAGSWDNTARKGKRANIFHGCTPPEYEGWLRHTVEFARKNPVIGNRSMVFINAWNEWAEGVYLEPDRKFGYALLAATQRVAFGLPPEPHSP